MGIGDAFTKVFGGGNDYQAATSPFLGGPQATPQEIYKNYLQQNAAYQKDIDQAGSLKIPSSAFNARASNRARSQQNAFSQNLNQRMGENLDFGTQGSMGQQQALINQILAQGRGEGPNPALDQLRMTTNQNANQANAIMASNRGINPALAAKLASEQVANANQQAAGQAALQSAQQQIAAQQLGGGLLGQQIGQLTQQTGLNADNQARYANLLASNLASMRGADIQQAAASSNANLGLLQQRLAAEAQRTNALQNYQNMVNNVTAGANTVNAGVAAQNAQTSGNYGMGVMSGISQSLGQSVGSGGTGMYKGGKVQKMSSGGTADAFYAFQGANPQTAFLTPADTKGEQTLTSGLVQKLGGAFSPKPQVMGDYTIPAVGAPAMASSGGKVPGKAKIDKDSPKNDIVPALLSPGEVVIPRSALGSAQDAHNFLDQIIQKNYGPSYRKFMKGK